jgi:hypothetical protein
MVTEDNMSKTARQTLTVVSPIGTFTRKTARAYKYLVVGKSHYNAKQAAEQGREQKHGYLRWTVGDGLKAAQEFLKRPDCWFDIRVIEVATGRVVFPVCNCSTFNDAGKCVECGTPAPGSNLNPPAAAEEGGR